MRTELGQQVEIERLETLKRTYEQRARGMDDKIEAAQKTLSRIRKSKVPSVWVHHLKTTISTYRGFGGVEYPQWRIDAEYKGRKFGFLALRKPTFSHAKKVGERRIEDYKIVEWETYTGGSVKMKTDFLQQCLQCAFEREKAERENAAKAEEVKAALVGSDEDFKEKVN